MQRAWLRRPLVGESSQACAHSKAGVADEERSVQPSGQRVSGALMFLFSIRTPRHKAMHECNTLSVDVHAT